MRRSWCVAAVVAAGVLPSGTVSAAPCGRDAAMRARTWFAASPPLPPRGPAREAVWGPARTVKAAGIDPADARILLMTDGTAVQRSDDGGCTWSEVWRLGPLPGPSMPDDTLARITSLDVARVGGRTRVLLTVLQATDVFSYVSRTLVVRSDDGRTGWTVAYETVGTYDTTAALATPMVRSGAGGVAYALLPSPLGHLTYVRSADGKAWETRTSPTEVGAPVRVLGYTVSPWNADELWEWHGASERSSVTFTGLRHSRDGARTWEIVDPFPGSADKPSWVTADIAWPRRGGPARLLLVGGSARGAVDPTPMLAWSGDGGASFGRLAPGTNAPLSNGLLAHTARGDIVIATRDAGVFRIPHSGRPPRPGEWRKLPAPPVAFTNERYLLGEDPARTTWTSPSVLLIPSFQRLQMLTLP